MVHLLYVLTLRTGTIVLVRNNLMRVEIKLKIVEIKLIFKSFELTKACIPNRS
jgi:hypothetical protein